MNLVNEHKNISTSEDIITVLIGLKGFKEKPLLENTKYLKNLDSCLTLGELEKRYAIDQENMYYRSNPNIRINSIKHLNFISKNEVRDFVTCCINQVYFDNCFERRIKPQGMIAVPEHLVNYVYSNVKNNNGDKVDELVSSIDDVLSRYTDKDGAMYFTCYFKQIKETYEKLKEYYGRHKGELLPNYWKGKDTQEYIVKYEEPEEKCSILKKRIKLAYDLRRMLIPPKYRVPVNIVVSNGKCK